MCCVWKSDSNSRHSPGFLFQPSSKKYFEDFCTTLESAEVEFMYQIFNERSVLFLGCDLYRPEYKSFFQKFAVNAKVNITLVATLLHRFSSRFPVLYEFSLNVS